MSGGVAYVLDEDGSFATRCNMGMVGFEEPSAADAIELRAMIEEHRERTGSPVATRVLGAWEELLGRGAFVKVMPHDYKRVLRERAEEQASSAPSDGGRPSSAGPRDTRSARIPEPASVPEPASEAGA
jgi:glutamate synthase domain-containing protein 3